MRLTSVYGRGPATARQIESQRDALDGGDRGDELMVCGSGQVGRPWPTPKKGGSSVTGATSARAGTRHRIDIALSSDLSNASLFAMLVVLSQGGTDGRHRTEGATGSVAQPRRICRCWRAYATGIHAERRVWEVRRRVMARNNTDNLIVDGSADTFEAAKAAALFEANAILGLSPRKM